MLAPIRPDEVGIGPRKKVSDTDVQCAALGWGRHPCLAHGLEQTYLPIRFL